MTMPRLIVFITLLLAVTAAQAATIHVPAEQPTIQAGIDAASEGDIVLVAPGTYTGLGNYDILLNGKGLTVRSEFGPTVTIIDCQGLGRAFILRGSVTSEPTIDGFTIINGDGGNQGGAIECFGFSPTIRYCVFANNRAEYGGALYFNGKPGKSADQISSYPIIENSSFFGNTALALGSVYYANGGVSVVFTACLLSENVSNADAPLRSYENDPIDLNCCNLWENEPGDWISSLQNQATINDNMSIFPVRCSSDSGSFGLHETSPLLPENSPCGQLVGAIGVGCTDCYDFDEDGYCAIDDNCPGQYNPDQLDSDQDGTGDACQDDDGDGIPNPEDNCPGISNPNQEDEDGDGIGDLCDDDLDGDGILNISDNCVWVYNPEQIDFNNDGVGDICCCVGRIGDANGSGSDEPTIGDVSVLIDAKFITGICEGILPCLREADINGTGGCTPTCSDITIGDISMLIDYLFITAWHLGLPDCPDCD